MPMLTPTSMETPATSMPPARKCGVGMRSLAVKMARACELRGDHRKGLFYARIARQRADTASGDTRMATEPNTSGPAAAACWSAR